MASQEAHAHHAEPTPLRRPRADQARLVADVLRHQIHAGGYSDGLPSEQDLAAEFFVSRNTVREALAALKDEGLIDRGPRVGTHVAIRKYDHGLDALVGLKETFKGYGEIRNEVRAGHEGRCAALGRPPAATQPGRARRLHRTAALPRRPAAQPGHDLPRPRHRRARSSSTPSRPTTCSRSSSRSPAGASAEPPWRSNPWPPTRIPRRSCRCPTARRSCCLERLTHLDDGRPVDLEYIRMRGDRITLRSNLIRGN